ncbi:hypothetical protein ES702_05403 [subsurface metagenome]
MPTTTEKRDIEEAKTEPQPSATTLEDLQQQKTIDTIHADEALKVLANYAGDEAWAEKEEKKLVKKIDRKLLPLLILTYGW